MMSRHLIAQSLDLLLVLCMVSVCVCGRVLKRVGLRPPASSDVTDIPEQWFTQSLDHFDHTNNQIWWQQRYYELADYYVEGGPVFLMVGGEGEASASWLVLGNWVNYAKQYNAYMFLLEHRFYGKSHPTRDLSVDNLRFLSSEQALADVAQFISSVGRTSQYNLTGAHWVLFGGSYPGNLVAWARLKYPHLVHASMAASGPVLAKVDFPEYMEVVRNSLSTYGENCVRAIRKADHSMNKLLKNSVGQKVINQLFRLCDPIDVTNRKDVMNLLEWLADNIAGAVQYSDDNCDWRFSTCNITIHTVCDIMTDRQLGNPLKRYAVINSMYLDAYGETCLDYKYDNMIAQLRNTSWDSAAADGSRQWTYQTCAEFGFYQTSENKSELYRDDFPLQFFLEQCSDIFGETFTEDSIYQAVDWSNTMYGALDLEATRVVYVHGTIDPWHVLGITETRVKQSPAILINGTAHCANMYPPRDSDLPQLQEARKTVGELIGKWLREE